MFCYIANISQEYYKKFGESGNKKHWEKKFGSPFDPKNGTRPYLIFCDSNNQKWAIPSTTKTSKRIKLIEKNPERFIKYWSFNTGRKQYTVFDFYFLMPTTDKYILDIKI